MYKYFAPFIALALAPAPAQAQAAAQAAVSVRIVDPVGIGAQKDPAAGNLRMGARGAEGGLDGSFTLSGARDRTVSIEHSASSTLQHSDGLGMATLRMSVRRTGEDLRIGGAVRPNSGAQAGLYSGVVSLVVNFN